MSLVVSLEAENFRLFYKRQWSFHKEINFFWGANGSGKTSLLEALYLFSYGRSFRTSQRRELVNSQGPLRLKMNILTQESFHELLIHFDGKRCIRLRDGKPSSALEFISDLFSLYLGTPLIFEVFTSRKGVLRWIDSLCAGLDSLYIRELFRYNKVLESRNRLLRDGKVNNFEFEVWNDKFIEGARRILERRVHLLKELNLRLKGRGVSLQLYGSSLRGPVPFDEEIRLKKSLWGPHLDGVRFLGEERDLRIFGSTGLWKTAFFTVVEAFSSLFQERTGQRPLLLVDDFDADLDRDHQGISLESIRGQAVLTYVTSGLFSDRTGCSFLEV